MNPAPPQPTEGWYPDPYSRYEYRWFNGAAWTGDVSNDGQRLIDPYGADPSITPTPYGSYGIAGSGGVAYGTPSAPARNGSATASVALGVIAILITWMPFIVVIGVILAIIAIVLGFSSRGAARAAGQSASAGTAGIICGFIALGLAVIGLWLTALFVSATNAFTYPGPFEASVESCRTSGTISTVTGSLTNRSATTRSYTVFVQLVDAERSTAPQTLSDVKPGASAKFKVTLVATSDSPDCDATLEVFGPFPFGIEMSPPN